MKNADYNDNDYNDDDDNDDTHQGGIIVRDGRYSVADKKTSRTDEPVNPSENKELRK